MSSLLSGRYAALSVLEDRDKAPRTVEKAKRTGALSFFKKKDTRKSSRSSITSSMRAFSQEVCGV